MTAVGNAASGTKRGETLLKRAERALARLWHGVVVIAAVITPAWPLWGGVILAFWALLFTGQGRQALIAVLAGHGEGRMMLAMTFVFLALHSFTVCLGFLEATRHRDEVRGQSLRHHRLRRCIAVFTALFLPLVFFGYVLMNIPLRPGDNLSGALLAAGLLTTTLLAALPSFALHFFRVKDTAFGQIATLDGKAAALLTGLGIILTAFAAATGFLPAARNAIGPVAIFLLAVTVYGFWMTRIVTIFRLRHLPPIVLWILIILIGSAIYAHYCGRTAYHAIATIANEQSPSPIDAMAKDWLGERKDDEEIRAVIVLAEGGGIYAAHHAATSLAHLDALSGDTFYNDVFAISGVSGGSVGIATYLAARADIEAPADRIAAINKFMSGDFLSPLAAGLLFRDIPFRLIPGADIATGALGMPREDRARLFEHELSRQWKLSCGESCKDRFDESFFSVAAAARRDESAAGPVILLNAAREVDGRVETISNARFPPEDHGTQLQNLLDRFESDGKTIPLGAAAHVSARFPIISPRAIAETRTGKAKRSVALVDGGYADNSGATAASFAVEALQRQAKKLGVAHKLKIIVLHYHSRAIVGDRTNDGANRVDILAELVVPVRAALAVQARRSAGPVENLCRTAAAGAANGEFCRAPTGRREIIDDTADSDGTFQAAPVRGDVGVTWISSPLDIAFSASDSRFVPLGWYLGGSGDYVAGEAQLRSENVCAALGRCAGASPYEAATP